MLGKSRPLWPQHPGIGDTDHEAKATKASPFIAPVIIIGAVITSCRSAATNVTVFQAPNGTRPITRSPRSAAKQPGHVGVHRCLINEDKVGGYQASPAHVSSAGGRELHPPAPARQREGLFFNVTA